jgi:hypothetical protein
MFAKSVKCFLKGSRAARSGCSFGGSFSHFGPPTEPKRMASLLSHSRNVLSGSALPWLSMPEPPTSAGRASRTRPSWRATCSSTRSASAITSGPM